MVINWVTFILPSAEQDTKESSLADHFTSSKQRGLLIRWRCVSWETLRTTVYDSKMCKVINPQFICCICIENRKRIQDTWILRKSSTIRCYMRKTMSDAFGCNGKHDPTIRVCADNGTIKTCLTSMENTIWDNGGFICGTASPRYGGPQCSALSFLL